MNYFSSLDEHACVCVFWPSAGSSGILLKLLGIPNELYQLDVADCLYVIWQEKPWERERLTVSIKASCSECMLIAECVWAFLVTALFSRLGYDDLTVRWQPMVDFYDTGYELSSLSLRHVTFFTAFIRVSSDAEVGDKHTHPFPQPLISLISHQLHVQWDKGSLSGHCW